MTAKLKKLPFNKKADPEKREIDGICKRAERLHGGKLVPIVDKSHPKCPQIQRNSQEGAKIGVTKKMRIIEQVYVFGEASRDEQLMISYIQKRPSTTKPKIPPQNDTIPTSTEEPIIEKKTVTDSETDSIPKPPTKTVDITYDSRETSQFRGVIRYLTEKCHGNVHNEGVIDITSSSVINEGPPTEGYPEPYNCVDLDDIDSSFASDYEENAWLCFDFKERRVKPSAYSIRTYVYGPNHLQSWCVEGSNDQLQWLLLDEQVSSQLFDNIGKSVSFQIKPSDEVDFFRYLRVRLTGPTVSGKHILNVSALEFFGSLLGSDPVPRPRKRREIKKQKIVKKPSGNPSFRPRRARPRSGGNSAE